MNNRILFVEPAKMYFIDKNGKPLAPIRQNVSLPALTILGSLKSDGFDVYFMDLTAEGYEIRTPINNYVYRCGLPDDAVVQRINDIKPLALLVTSMFSAEQHVVDNLAAKVKRAYPKLPIIVGGIHATIKPEWVLESGNVDFVILGEGEEIISKILRQIQSGKPPLNKVIGPNPLLKNLDRKWAFDEVLLKNRNYRYVEEASRRSKLYSHLTLPNWTRSFSLYYSRGCPMHCDYCATSERAGFVIRHAGSKRMFNDLKLLHEKYGVRVFYNQADTFGYHHEDIKFLKLVKYYRKRHRDFVLNNPNAFFVRMFFKSENYILDESLINLLADSGFNVITIAVETFNQRFNKKINFDKITPEKIRSLFQTIHERGMKTELYMIYAFPTQTLDELLSDEMIVGTIPCIDEVAWQSCMILPGTEYYRRGMAERLFTEKSYRKTLKEGHFFYHLPKSFNFTNIPQKELERFRVKHNANF